MALVPAGRVRAAADAYAGADLIPALVRVAQLAQAFVLAEVLTPNGLDWNEYQILRVVAVNPNIRSARAAQRVGMSRATLSGVVARLAERGLIHRAAVNGGQRQVNLALTGPGHELWSRITRLVADAEHRMVQRPTARRTLDALSRRIVGAVTAH